MLDIVDHYVYPGGDDLADYFNRAAEKVRRLVDQEEGNVLACTHAGFMGSAIGGIFLGDVDTMFALRIPTCGIIKVWREDGEYRYEML